MLSLKLGSTIHTRFVTSHLKLRGVVASRSVTVPQCGLLGWLWPGVNHCATVETIRLVVVGGESLCHSGDY